MGVGIALELLHPFAINEDVPERFVGARDKIGMPRAGGGHAERFVELFFRRALPFHAVGFDCGDRRCCYPEVRVGVVRAETAFGMLIA